MGCSWSANAKTDRLIRLGTGNTTARTPVDHRLFTAPSTVRYSSRCMRCDFNEERIDKHSRCNQVLPARREGHPARCGSFPRPNIACGSPGGCSSQAARMPTPGFRISVSSPLLGDYDEPGILRYSMRPICLIDAGEGHAADRSHRYFVAPRRSRAASTPPPTIKRLAARIDQCAGASPAAISRSVDRSGAP